MKLMIIVPKEHQKGEREGQILCSSSLQENIQVSSLFL